MPEFEQDIADEVTRIVHSHLEAYRVSRASDLPEEGKVSLLHAVTRYLDATVGPDALPPDGLAAGWRAACLEVRDRIMRQFRQTPAQD